METVKSVRFFGNVSIILGLIFFATLPVSIYFGLVNDAMCFALYIALFSYLFVGGLVFRNFSASVENDFNRLEKSRNYSNQEREDLALTLRGMDRVISEFYPSDEHGIALSDLFNRTLLSLTESFREAEEKEKESAQTPAKDMDPEAPQFNATLYSFLLFRADSKRRDLKEVYKAAEHLGVSIKDSTLDLLPKGLTETSSA